MGDRWWLLSPDTCLRCSSSLSHLCGHHGGSRWTLGWPAPAPSCPAQTQLPRSPGQGSLSLLTSVSVLDHRAMSVSLAWVLNAPPGAWHQMGTQRSTALPDCRTKCRRWDQPQPPVCRATAPCCPRVWVRPAPILAHCPLGLAAMSPPTSWEEQMGSGAAWNDEAHPGLGQ